MFDADEKLLGKLKERNGMGGNDAIDFPNSDGKGQETHVKPDLGKLDDLDDSVNRMDLLALREKEDALQRRRFADRVFRLVTVYISIIIFIVFLCGIGLLSISNSVLIALPIIVTANVVSLVVIVMKYILPERNSRDRFY